MIGVRHGTRNAVGTIGGVTPAERVRAACARLGTDAVVRWCVRTLTGGPWEGEVLDAIGGTAAHDPEWMAKPVNHYWPRVWAARALLYTWLPYAAPAVVGALSDEAWRVREMAAKVARLRELGEAADLLSTLVDDGTARVRIAAIRALALVGEGEHAQAVLDARQDPEPGVRKAAITAVAQMARRLDRPL